MKIAAGILSAILFLTGAPFSMAAPKKSKISSFQGKYSGKVNYASFASGPATATIKTRASKEIGTINLHSNFVLFGTPQVLRESISLSGRKAVFSYRIASVSVLAQGPARVSKNVIRYNVPVVLNGVPYMVKGVAVLNGKKLVITETFVSKDTSYATTYVLKRTGK